MSPIWKFIDYSCRFAVCSNIVSVAEGKLFSDQVVKVTGRLGQACGQAV